MNKRIYGIVAITDEEQNNRIDALEAIKDHVFTPLINETQLGYDSVKTRENSATSENTIGTDPRDILTEQFNKQLVEQDTETVSLGENTTVPPESKLEALVEKANEIDERIKEVGSKKKLPPALLGIKQLGDKIKKAQNENTDLELTNLFEENRQPTPNDPAVIPLREDRGNDLLKQAWEETKHEIVRYINHQNAPEKEIAPDEPLEVDELTPQLMKEYNPSQTSISIFTDGIVLPKTITSKEDYQAIIDLASDENVTCWIAPGTAHY